MKNLISDGVRKWFFPLWFAGLLFMHPLLVLAQPAPDPGGRAPSILNPAGTFRTEYRFPIQALDPSPETNPTAANAPGYRGDHQLVIYTPAFGPNTRTGAYNSLEAVVTDGVVQSIGTHNSAIPPQGWVVSAHGHAARWVQKFVKPGAQVRVDRETRQLVVRLTPAMYLHEIDSALNRLEGRESATNVKNKHAHYVSQTQTCRERIAEAAQSPVTAEMAAVAESCLKTANLAFYQTVESRPAEFRGAWIRPYGKDVETIQKTIESLKKHRVKHVFLETYYQGKTIYPSTVMREYGLPEQHPQYVGADPLQLWIDAAHQADLKVHVWTQVFFAGNERENAERFGPVLQKYPQWRNVQRPYWNKGEPVASTQEPGHYFLDPAHPEVRSFLEKLLLEMVSRYPIDGLSLDYIRYPASLAPNKPGYLNSTWGYTESARQQFRAMIEQERQAAEAKRAEELKKAGKRVSADPKDLVPSDPLWPRWVAWRTEQVSSFVQNISDKAHLARSDLRVSAVVFPSADPAYAQKLQDYPRWAKEGWIQALTPIGLSPLPNLMLQQSLLLKQATESRVPIYVGIFGMYNRQTPLELVLQIEAVHQADMPGVILFDWSRLNAEYDEALNEGPFRE